MQVRTLGFADKVKQSDPLRRGVAGMSSGDSYTTPQQWHFLTAHVCSVHRYTLGALPPIHVGLDEQLDRFYIPLYQGDEEPENEVGAIWVSIYRLPQSGEYEIVCGVV